MKKIIIAALTILSCLGTNAAATAATNILPLIDKATKDIKTATQELNKQRDNQEKQKTQFATTIEELETQVANLQKQCAQLQKELDETSKQTRILEDKAQNANTQLSTSYAALRNLETELAISAIGSVLPQKITAGFKTDPAEFAKQTLDCAQNQATQALHPIGLQGRCVSTTGELKTGTFIVAGPCLHFKSNDGKTAGMATVCPKSNAPKIILPHPIDMYTPDSSGTTLLVQDISGGKALSLKTRKGGIKQTLKAGGAIIIPILALGVLCLFTAVWKFLHLATLNTKASASITQITAALAADNHKLAHKLAQQMGQPLGPIIHEGISYANCPREHLEELLHEKILSQIPLLEKRLPILSVSAAVSPLLGLLGTVTGMIHTFELVTIFGTGNANFLSEGISQALITTEYGLIVAIPALVTHAWLSRRVKKVISTLEQTSASFINQIKIPEAGNDRLA